MEARHLKAEVKMLHHDSTNTCCVSHKIAHGSCFGNCSCYYNAIARPCSQTKNDSRLHELLRASPSTGRLFRLLILTAPESWTPWLWESHGLKELQYGAGWGHAIIIVPTTRVMSMVFKLMLTLSATRFAAYFGLGCPASQTDDLEYPFVNPYLKT